MYYYRMMDANDWASAILMLLLGLLFVAAVVVVASRLLRTSDRTNLTQGRSLPPLDILKERYAKGEIDRDEYERIRKDLLS